ncbi:hypothetical protein PTKIN_Ptkin19aG0102900 [Pterospermum kingtungense]
MLEESMSTVTSSIWASIFSWFTPTVFFVFLNLTIGTIYFTSTSLASNSPGRVRDGAKQEGEEETETPKLVRSPSVLQRLKSINLYSYRSQEPVSATATAYEKIPDVGHDDDDDGVHLSVQQQTPPEHDQRQHQQHQQPLLDRSPSVLHRLKPVNLHGYFSPEPTPLHTNQEIHQAHEEEEEEEEEEQETEAEVEENHGEEQTLDEIYSELKDSHVVRTKSDTKPASGELPTKLPRKMNKSASVKSPFSHFKEEEIVEKRRPATVREGKGKSATEEDDGVDAKADDFIYKFKQQLKLQRIDSILRYNETVNRGSGR